jgi:hypothetical protein
MLKRRLLEVDVIFRQLETSMDPTQPEAPSPASISLESLGHELETRLSWHTSSLTTNWLICFTSSLLMIDWW